MWLDWGSLPPIRRGLLTSPLREWQARRAIETGWGQWYEQSADLPARREGLFVSLTSHKPRFGTLALTLRSLLLQTLRPEGVLLWIGKRDLAALPEEIVAMQPHGLRIEICEDHGPHTKYHHALKRYPFADIAICDDDTWYPSDWLEKLVSARQRGVIACHRAHRIALDSAGVPKGYRHWDHDVRGPDASTCHFGTGVGGILLRAELLDQRVLDIKTALELCPTADDMWLYFMARLAGTNFCQSGWTTPFVTWSGSQGSALWKWNVAASGNDISLEAMLDRFGHDIAVTEGSLPLLAA